MSAHGVGEPEKAKSERRRQTRGQFTRRQVPGQVGIEQKRTPFPVLKRTAPTELSRGRLKTVSRAASRAASRISFRGRLEGRLEDIVSGPCRGPPRARLQNRLDGTVSTEPSSGPSRRSRLEDVFRPSRGTPQGRLETFGPSSGPPKRTVAGPRPSRRRLEDSSERRPEPVSRAASRAVVRTPPRGRRQTRREGHV